MSSRTAHLGRVSPVAGCLAGVLLLGSLAGCARSDTGALGTGSAGSPTPTGTARSAPSGAPTSPGTPTVDRSATASPPDSAQQAAVTLHVGQTLLVTAPTGGLPEVTFTLDGTTASALTPVDGATKRGRAQLYRAVAPGSTTVVVTGHPDCSKGIACPALRSLEGRLQVRILG